MKVLITGSRSATALKLIKAFAGHRIYLADYGDMPSFPSKDYEMLSLGEKNDDTLAHTLLSYCLDLEIDLILPIHLAEIEAIAKSKVLFSEFNIDTLVPDASILNTYLNKSTARKDWAIFNKGTELYSSSPNPLIAQLATQEWLNGAFYYKIEQDDLAFELITN